ncbi:RNA polymerase sigma factor [Paracoccus ravus]|uniref:RNA polymerase sigma factor n=1 Tax=Paracoccus ravus TaxID=2447760 RepID=UPI00106E3136|nr:sigma-70 family RNA polymerase sigma factor [Paracoccus ravus]
MPVADAARIDAIFRIERARLIASLARNLHGDLALAEDLAQDALVTALEVWTRAGVPDNPGAWLRTVAGRKAVDEWRRRRMQERKHGLIAAEDAEPQQDTERPLSDSDDPDSLLALIFATCHPVLDNRSAAALALRLLAGLTAEEIAHAYLTSEEAVTRRISRAKATLRMTARPFEIPCAAAFDPRVAAVLETLYLIFAEGYAASRGCDPVRPDLCAEAVRLTRILLRKMPDRSEAWALLALMELQSSRLRARSDADGIAVPLTAQDRGLWDHHAILRGTIALAKADALAMGDAPYLLEAMIAVCHACPGQIDWPRIARLYDRLFAICPSSVVALNRAVAWSMAEGPEEGLIHLADIEAGGHLRDSAALHAAIADCLRRCGQHALAAARYRRAAELAGNQAVKRFLLAQAEDR